MTQLAEEPKKSTELATRSVEETTEGGAINAFASEGNFIQANRMAKALAASSLLPKAYNGNVANCLIAIEIASRIGASIFSVAQNLDIIHGRPGFRATFLIATVNASNKFTPLRYRWQGKEGTDAWGCRAVAKDREGGEECVGALITIGLAKAEGWFDRAGTKWKTIPEQMLMYRAAAFWSRVYCPELSLGMQTTEEVIDVTGAVESSTTSVPAFAPANSKALEDALMANRASFKSPDGASEQVNAVQKTAAPVMHDEDGVIIEPQEQDTGDKPGPEREPGED
jgi:hypothetical protein